MQHPIQAGAAAALHLSSHALNSHNLISSASNHSPKSPSQTQQQQQTTNQQQQQQQQQASHSILSTFAPAPTVAAVQPAGSQSVAGTAAAVAAVAQQQQQQHLQLLANCPPGGAGLMSSSLNAAQMGMHGAERALPPKSLALSGSQHGSNMLLHTAPQPPQASQPAAVVGVSGSGSAGMSTSLHSFDINGVTAGSGVNASSAWSSGSTTAMNHASLSPTALAPQQGRSRCEVKLNAMP